ncbi:MAG: threonine synthase, partial [Chromatiaceae bacterium]|nr:threonine synthase [Chromatiaceae bacterium]
ICLATAHPAKFGEAVTLAIGREAPPPPSLRGLLEKETRCARLEASAEAIRAHIQDTLEAASL